MIASPIAERLVTSQSSGARRYFGLKVRAGAWVLVPREGARARDGLAIYNPQSLGGILKKALANRGVWAGKRIYLRDQMLREIEAVLEEQIGIAPLHCAFYFRSPGLFSKTIALALDRYGCAVAYVKFGVTAEGEMALARETDALDKLAAVPELASCVPRVIGRGRWLEYPMLVVSVGAPSRRCGSFGPAQETFLHDLRKATAKRKAFRDSVMWKAMSTRFAAGRAALGTLACERYVWALENIENRLGSQPLTMSLAHRDFVPWNMHYDHNGALFVYDWELAQDECTPGWDFFHYHLASQPLRPSDRIEEIAEALLREAERAGIAPARDCLLGYLADVGLFLRDRLWRSPGKIGNTYVSFVEAMMDCVFRDKMSSTVAHSTRLTEELAP